MAEEIRSILLKEYRANKVDVSQKMDANSFADSGGSSSSWSFSSNSTLFILCAVVLCGGIIIGFQKKFPFKYQNVYSKLLTNNNNNNNNDNIDNDNNDRNNEIDLETNNFKSKSIDKYSRNGNESNNKNERELNVSSSPKTKNSAEEFLQKVLKNSGTPSFITTKYIQNLKSDYISSIEQLREFDDGDWKRYGFKKSHIKIIKNKLNDDEDDDDDEEDNDQEQDEDDDDDSELSDFSDDNWNDNNKTNNVKKDNKKLSKKSKSKNNNESTTDFDDF